MVGRWPGGAPLVHAPGQDDPALATDNDFGYFASDPDGLRCPLGAHIRRANPRDSLDPQPGSAESIAIGRRHRLLRRGRAYGENGQGAGEGRARTALPLPQREHLPPVRVHPAHLAQQPELQRPLRRPPDPLAAPRDDREATFTEQARPVRTRHLGMPQFVSVRGGAYFFLPGIRALRYLGTETRTGPQP
ncbi:hypothetical protein GCM10020000_02200 [Streptomyces olivoverticillatus]